MGELVFNNNNNDNDALSDGKQTTLPLSRFGQVDLLNYYQISDFNMYPTD